MGCEAFQVVLRCRAPLELARRLVFSVMGAVRDPQGGQLARDYAVYRDGSHVIEMELSGGSRGTEVSVRFALCHPNSIDEAFIELVQRLAKELTGEVSIMADPPSGMRSDFPEGDLSGFAESARAAIAADRGLWIAEFGNERAAMGCDEAMRRFVLRED